MPLTRQQLEIVYRDLETPLYNFALRWVFNSAVAEDVVHDAFIRIWKMAGDADPVTLKSLLYKTVQNLSLNELRKRRVREAFAIIGWFNDEAAQVNAEDSAIDQESLKEMRIGLEKLPIEMREVLLLSQFSDMNYAEIAKTLGIAEGTVASRKSRALQLMRDHMNAEDYQDGRKRN